jgi:hypothetical protein
MTLNEYDRVSARFNWLDYGLKPQRDDYLPEWYLRCNAWLKANPSPPEPAILRWKVKTRLGIRRQRAALARYDKTFAAWHYEFVSAKEDIYLSIPPKINECILLTTEDGIVTEAWSIDPAKELMFYR